MRQEESRDFVGKHHAREIAGGKRFAFGQNWRGFLETVGEDRIAEARNSLRLMLDSERLDGKTFLDIGSGSGLFSLAARQLGAAVTSFDYDPDSVACTNEMRRRYRDGDAGWIISDGSVLDGAFLKVLGAFDIVYAWGVLHHSGNMWQALANAASLVKPGGWLFISIYNDQGWTSRRWTAVKRIYCSGMLGKCLITAVFIPYFVVGGLAMDILHGINPVRRYTEYKYRGMSRLHDWVDWLGGYPFEVAKPEQIFDLYRNLGFTLERLKTCGGGLGCNEYVFLRARHGR